MNQTKNRHSTRLKGYDYSSPGVYFVTICSADRICRFGDIQNGEIFLSPIGQILEIEWRQLYLQFPHIQPGISVAMPNHFHGIIEIKDLIPSASQQRSVNGSPAGSLGTIIGQFKSKTTRRIWKISGIKTPVWQRNYYEHVVRNETEWAQIVEYIQTNPLRWDEDQLNPIVL